MRGAVAWISALKWGLTATVVGYVVPVLALEVLWRPPGLADHWLWRVVFWPDYLVAGSLWPWLGSIVRLSAREIIAFTYLFPIVGWCAAATLLAAMIGCLRRSLSRDSRPETS